MNHKKLKAKSIFILLSKKWQFHKRIYISYDGDEAGKEDAKKLSSLMKKIGEYYNREVRTIISDMNTPLGKTVGNSLEVIEAMDILKGKKGQLRDLCINVSSKIY